MSLPERRGLTTSVDHVGLLQVTMLGNCILLITHRYSRQAEMLSSHCRKLVRLENGHHHERPILPPLRVPDRLTLAQ